MRRGELFRRAGLVGAFALLLVVCVAAPVLAQPVLAPTEEDPVAREEALESPRAVAERESSEYAYVDLTPAEEEELLREHFGPQLRAIDADPARALADVVIDRIDSPTEALVTLEGEKVLLESEVPLRAPEEDGDLHKVELELEETAAGYEPANPLVDLGLPDSAGEPIRVGEEGLAITPVGTADAAASPLGEEDLFLPAAHEDTSLLLSPIAGGLELSALLASRNSPQRLAFEVTLPPGASLRAEETGGAAVVREGEVLAVVGAPHAVDAQGTEVPAALSVEGDTLTLSLAHREMDVAYPLFVDPTIEENWSGFADPGKLSYWKWSWGGVGPEDFIGKTGCIVISACWGNGLYVRARANFAYPAGSWARWWFAPQGTTTYIRRAVLGPIHFEPRNCWESEPHAYTGIWNDSGYWEVLGNAYPTGYMTGVDAGELKPGTRTIFVGFHAGASSTLGCGRDYHFGGATLFLDDPENPTAGATSGYPTGWIKDGAQFTINGPVSDPGLGVKKGFLYPKQSVTQKSELSCDGHYSNPCPANHTFQFSIGADSFDEGEKSVEFSAEDVLGKPSNTHKWTMKVDRTPPEMDLAGQLAIATGETGSEEEDEKEQALKLPVYNLTINTTDGKTPAEGAISPAERRSGVKGIAVFLDQKQTPEAVWETSSCPEGNCPLSKTFTLKLNELSAGTEHTLHVIAQDFAGNDPRVRHIEFEYIPATGIKDEYVMQYFPLPDGSGNEEEEEHPRRPELAVNLVNGNLVYRQKDVEVETASADLEVELFYNSLLPESQNTEWGDGWTMGEEPSLEIEAPEGSGPPTEATIVEESGAIESRVDLPAAVGEESFDERIQATVAKEPGGGYTVTDETGEAGDSLVFSPSGRLDEVENGTAATVDYGYEEGAVAEIAIEDPGTADVAPGTLDEDEVYPDLAIGHSADFGAPGAEAGQFNAPADVATDAHGNVFVLDGENHRVQKLGPGGQFLSQFGGYGSADGQLASPGAIALDAEGNVWVTDTGNDRVQKFSPAGQFLAKFGSGGFGAGKFLGPKGIAVGKDGSIWVADHRLQRFTAAGQFIERVGAEQIVSPRALDADAEGNVFVADPELDRILVFDQEGDYLRGFGASGTGPGELQAPVEVDADADGGVWVADEQSDRVQLFNAAGDYIAGFGSPGSGAQQFQFEFPSGIASDGKGRVWIADAGNDRVAEWAGGNYEPSDDPVLTEDDPRLEVEVSEGLVQSVEGDEAGTVSYGHSGDLLTSVEGPDTDADFTYDGAGRMTKVTLANGTYAEIEYADSYGRVKSVAVAPEGANKKVTFFNYSDEPRRTTVIPPDGPITTYDFAADGGVFKWWNSSQPPILDYVAGTLHDNRETSQPIPVGEHTLSTQAHSDEGIASIQIIADNNQLVDEKTCEFDPEEPGSCLTVKNEWVTETGNWPPGIVHLEVIATDRLGNSTSERFWVNIPYTPPPDPEAEEAPRFSDILSFREEFGLDLDLKGDEFATNDRIFDLIGAWHNPTTPEGEVARATNAKWGVPLRAIDAAELEYRDRYLAHNAPLISQWGETQAWSSFAGFYMDHPAGGLIRVGFTNNQTASVEVLKGQPGLVATDRFTTFSAQPSWSLSHLQTLSRDFDSRVQSRPDVLATMSGARLDIAENRLELGSDSLPLLSSFVQGVYGSTSAISTFFQERLGVLRDQETCYEEYSPRARLISDGNLYAGDWFRSDHCGCTLAFGAWSAKKGPQGQWIKNNYALSAGHCDYVGNPVFRAGLRINSEGKKVEAKTKIGTVARNSEEIPHEGFETDAEAIDLAEGVQVPRRIFRGANKSLPIINGAGDWTPGMTLCLSGAFGGSRCGATKPELLKEYFGELPIWLIVVKTYSECGDSGSPIWNPRTGEAIALLTGGPGGCAGGPTWVTPILSLEGKPYAPEVGPGTAPGALNAPDMNSPKPLNIVDGVN